MANATRCCRCHSKYCSLLQSRLFRPLLKSLYCTLGNQKCPCTPTGMAIQMTCKQCNIVHNIKTKFHVKFNSLIVRGGTLCPNNEKPMTDTTNPHLCLHLGIIFVGTFQAGFSMEIFKEVNSVKCVLGMNILISYSLRALGLNN